MKAIWNGIPRNKKGMDLVNRRGYSRKVQVCKNIFCKEQKRILLLHQCRMQRALWKILHSGSKKPLHLPVGSQFVIQGCPYYFSYLFKKQKSWKKGFKYISYWKTKMGITYISIIKACIQSSEIQHNIYCLTVTLISFQHFISRVL